MTLKELLPMLKQVQPRGELFRSITPIAIFAKAKRPEITAKTSILFPCFSRFLLYLVDKTGINEKSVRVRK
jgi:hypothetical protein